MPRQTVLMMTLATAVDTSAPTPFEWLTGVWIPVIVGAASIAVASIALLAAIAANRTARAALVVAREATDRDARMPRERVAHAAIMSLNAAMNNRPETGEDFELRIVPTMNELVQSAGTQGVEPASVQQLVRWLGREAGAIAAATTSDPQRYHELPSERMGMLALRLSFGLRVDEWVKTERITETATVAEEQADMLKPLPSGPTNA